MIFDYKENMKEIVRGLRQNQTPEEEKLWQLLRNRKFKNLKFLRQHPIIYEHYGKNFSFYVADFYCAEKNLILEIDGKIHDDQKEYDNDRTDTLNELGYQVLRIKNEEFSDINLVLNKIELITNSPPAPLF